MKSFASDNYSGAAPEIMQAIIEANCEHQPSYGNDSYTAQAQELLKATFGHQSESFFVYNGTAANSVALKAIVRSHHAILCSSTAHIATQEVGAVNNLTGCQTFIIPHENGKISAAAVQAAYNKATYWGHHGNLPKIVSVAQTTELGTVYSFDELRAISKVCRDNELIFHMDGCRLSNAAAFLNCSLVEVTRDVGVDVLSFGGTKNGLLFGEAIIFFKPELAKEFAYIHKQNLQLNSKMRFLSAQFIPYLRDKLWHRYAEHANQMCQRLTTGLLELEGVKLAYPQQSNQVFVYLPEKIIQATQNTYPFYLWDKEKKLARLVASFDTTIDDVDTFVKLARTA